MNLMIKNLLHSVLEIIIGFSSGVVIGAGFLSIMIVLGVIPRLIRIAKAKSFVHVFGAATIAGILFGTYLSFTDWTWKTPIIGLIGIGLFQGIFNGMVAAALTEILNVFPLLSKRMGLKKHILPLLMAIVFGKVIGSLFQWLYLVQIGSN